MNIARDEVLIHRVLEGEAGRADWAELELIAEGDRDVWARLARSLQVESLLRSALDCEVAVADSIELPELAPRESETAGSGAPFPSDAGHGSAGVYPSEAPELERKVARRAALASVGWAAALVFCFLWGWNVWSPVSPDAGFGLDGSQGEAGLSSSAQVVEPNPLSSEELFQQYVRAGQETGRVVTQLPRMVMDTRTAPAGNAVEVLYLRPVVERMTVDEFYRTASDEHGNAVRMKVPFRQLRRGGSL